MLDCPQLRTAGYDVKVAGSLSEALQQATAQPDIGLLVTDYHLGNGETGIELIAALRRTSTSALKAVLVTGDIFATFPALQRDNGLRIAHKPINSRKLLSLLAELTAH